MRAIPKHQHKYGFVDPDPEVLTDCMKVIIYHCLCYDIAALVEIASKEDKN
jgi:hypothetical protein